VEEDGASSGVRNRSFERGGGRGAFPAATFLLLLAISFSPAARADETSVELIPIADTITYVKSLSLEFPVATSRSGAVPYGFQPSQLDPPLALRYSSQGLSTNGSMRGWVEANASFLSYSLGPMIGARGGGTFNAGGLVLSFGLGTELQNLVGKTPEADSQYATVFGEAIARAELPLGDFSAGLELRAVRSLGVTFATIEALKTQIDHATTYVFSPSVAYRAGALGLSAGVDVYSLGETAIASDEFAFALASSIVTRWSLGASYRFSLAYEGYAGIAFVRGVSDPLALFYAAPGLAQDYLLASSVLTLGVKWHL
jgi:hypothetical protein